ncbi:hypothetical protein FZ983_24470 [Azospirillum sp. B21]|uniref:hypothetical protein n=1 Tax=unclassified Azospirillum TaxID=2630922 RepID=UPI0011EF5DC8|nr:MULTISPECIES: hypothetical protein [unclassified Azospirillum]KAA0576211.1 hypothetical protein FZ983_24470 [Azospirillum sp. B21]MDR6774673.1 hypothetical protein [Azospirillum sp. BE72]
MSIFHWIMNELRAWEMLGRVYFHAQRDFEKLLDIIGDLRDPTLHLCPFDEEDLVRKFRSGANFMIASYEWMLQGYLGQKPRIAADMTNRRNILLSFMAIEPEEFREVRGQSQQLESAAENSML